VLFLATEKMEKMAKAKGTRSTEEDLRLTNRMLLANLVIFHSPRIYLQHLTSLHVLCTDVSLILASLIKLHSP
jgi:hypothetical protein